MISPMEQQALSLPLYVQISGRALIVRERCILATDRFASDHDPEADVHDDLNVPRNRSLVHVLLGRLEPDR